MLKEPSMFEEAVKYQEIACITFRRISKHVTQARHFVPKISHHALQHFACQMAVQYISYRNMLQKVCIKNHLQISALLYKAVQIIHKHTGYRNQEDLLSNLISKH